MTAVRIRALASSADAEIALVAARMRDTLIEVLGEERGGAMYSMEWLDDRVRHHLDPARCEGAVFLAEIGDEIVGHTIVRVETDEDGSTFGLFSTTYVLPAHRRASVASQLLDAGERWMVERDLAHAATYTSDTNTKLIRLYETRGYAIVLRTSEMVVLRRPFARAADGSDRAP